MAGPSEKLRVGPVGCQQADTCSITCTQVQGPPVNCKLQPLVLCCPPSAIGLSEPLHAW